MSCDAVAAAILFLATPNTSPALVFQAAYEAPATTSVAGEAPFSDIIAKAKSLKTRVDFYRAGVSASTDKVDFANFETFKKDIASLVALDMKGHDELLSRGLDGDLKCILRGIAQDLPVRLADVEKAGDPKGQDRALKEMAYLLNDNVEVLLAPLAATPA